MKISENLMSDPSWASFMAERELVPGSDILRPNVARLAAGEVKAESNAFMVREYIMDRSNWNDAINIVANVQKLLTHHGVNVTMGIPIIAGKLKCLDNLFRTDSVLIGKKHQRNRDGQRILINVGKGFQIGNLRQSMGHSWYTLINVES